MAVKIKIMVFWKAFVW